MARLVRMYHPKSDEELLVPPGVVERWRKLGFKERVKPPPPKSRSKSDQAPETGAFSSPEKKEEG